MKKLYSILSSIFLAAAALEAQQPTISVSPTTVNLTAGVGGSPVSQTINVTGSGATQFYATKDGNPSYNAPWLKVSTGGAPSDSILGSLPGTFTITADPTGLAVGTPGPGRIVVGPLGAAGTTAIIVNFTVSPVTASPSSLQFTYQLGSSFPNSQTINLTGAAAFTARAERGDWLLVTPPSGTSPTQLTASVNSSTLPSQADTYTDAILITPTSPAGAAIRVPVTLTVLGVPQVTFSATSVAFAAQTAPGGVNNVTQQTIRVSTNSSVNCCVLANFDYDGAGQWFTATSDASTISSASPATLTINVNTTGLAPRTYTGRFNVYTSGTPSVQQVTVTLLVSSSPLLNISTTSLPFTYQVGTNTPAGQSVTATLTSVAAGATTGQQPVTLTANPAVNWLRLPSNVTTGTPFTISVDPAGLAAQTTPYTTNVIVSANGAANAPQIAVSLRVTNEPFLIASVDGCTTANNPTGCALTLPYQIGQTAVPPKTITVASSTGAKLTYTTAVNAGSNATCGSNWLAVSGNTSGTTDSQFTLSVNAPGSAVTCSGSITISGTSGGAAITPVTIPVNLYVSAGALLTFTPSALNFSAAPNQPTTPQTLTLGSTNTTDVLNYSMSIEYLGQAQGWLFSNRTSGNTGNDTRSIQFNTFTTSLQAGVYNAIVRITATSGNTAVADANPLVIPVTLTVTGATMTVNPNSLSFNYTVGAAAPAAKNLTVSTSGSDIAFSVSAAMQNGTGWLKVAPASGAATTSTPATVAVSIDTTGLTAGTYNGSVTIAATTPFTSGSPVTIPVTLVVAPGTLSATPATLTFNQVAGAAAPAAQNITVAGTPGALPYTVAVATNNNSGNWLSATPASGNTNSNVAVSVNAGTLPVGQYTGKVTITSAGAQGSPIEIAVTMNVVSAQTFSISPSTLNFSHVLSSSTAPAPQTVQLTASAATAPWTAAATTSGGGNWLSVTPASGTGSGALTVSVNTAGLTTAGTYSGKIDITSPNSATNPAASITVNLTVSAVPKPVILAIRNAASWVSGGVSPGEMIVIGGTGIGPATIAGPSLVNNALPTTLGNTQVFFDNVPAPIYYALDNQTAVMVPYGVSGRATTSVRVVYSGVTSDSVTYNVVPAAPGIFTANQGGTGQIAIWEQQYVSAGAPKNGIITFYVTGEGNNVPNGTDGAIASASNSSAWYKPALPVTVTIGGVPATVEYYGTAPGVVYGVMQMNVRIPQNAPSGIQPIVVSLGSNQSQPTATINVQ